MFLKQNRISRVDASRSLNILLDCKAFEVFELVDNAKLLLKFVRMSERMNLEAEKFKETKFLTNGPVDVDRGLKKSMGKNSFESHSAFTQDD